MTRGLSILLLALLLASITPLTLIAPVPVIAKEHKSTHASGLHYGAGVALASNGSYVYMVYADHSTKDILVKKAHIREVFKDQWTTFYTFPGSSLSGVQSIYDLSIGAGKDYVAFAFVWYDGSDDYVRWVVIDKTGSLIHDSGDITVSYNSQTGKYGWTGVAFLNNSNVMIVVYLDGNTIKYTVYNAETNTEIKSDSIGNGVQPAVAASSEDFLVVYVNNGIKATQVDGSTGNIDGTTTVVSGNKYWRPDVAWCKYYHLEGWAIVYRKKVDSNYKPAMTVLDTSLNPKSEIWDKELSTDTFNKDMWPQVTGLISDNGTTWNSLYIIAVWHDSNKLYSVTVNFTTGDTVDYNDTRMEASGSLWRIYDIVDPEGAILLAGIDQSGNTLTLLVATGDAYGAEQGPIQPPPGAPTLAPGQLSNLAYNVSALKMVETDDGYVIATWVEETDTANLVGDLYFAVINKTSGEYVYGPTKIDDTVQYTRRVGSSVKGGTPQLVAGEGGKAYVVYVNGTSNYDIKIAELRTDGTYSIVYNLTKSGYQELPSVAYDPDHDLLAVSYLDDNATVAIFDVTDFSAGPTTVIIGDGGSFKYFHTDIVYADGYFVVGVLNRSSDEGGTYLATIDPSSKSLVDVVQIGGLPADISGQGPSIAYLESADLFLVVYVNDDNGDDHVFGEIFSLTATGEINIVYSDLIIDNVTEICKYPYAVAGANRWLVTWEKRKGNDDVYGAVVLTDGTVLGTIGIATDSSVDEGIVRTIWEPDLGTSGEWVVLYTYNKYTASAEIHGVRINESVYIGDSATILSSPSSAFTISALIDVGSSNTTMIMGYINCTNENEDPWYKYHDMSTIPAPSKLGYIRRARIVILSFTDSGGDGFVTPGESIVVQAKLQYYDAVDKTWKDATYEDQEITVTISRITYRDSEQGKRVYTTVYTTTTKTDASGQISVTINPDDFSEKISATYSVKLFYPGNETVNLQSAEEYSDIFTQALPVLFSTPTKTINGDLSDWQTAPTGAPILTYKNGELIVTDPSGDYRNDTSVYVAGEEGDIDITELHMALDNSFLYIAYKVAGSAELAGDVVPALAIAIDLDTDTSNGAAAGWSYNMYLWYGVYSDTALSNKRGWDVLVVLMPRFKPGDYDNIITVYTPIVYVYKNGTDKHYVRVMAGMLSISGDTVEAAIPLDIIGYYHDLDASKNIFINKNITIFNAIFPINYTSGRVVSDVPYANFFDYAGGLFNETQGFIPAGILNQGLTNEFWSDKEIDKYIVAAIDSSGKFFGYARIWSLNETVYKEGKAYTGLWSYAFQIKDHLNPMFGVPSVSVQASFNTSAETGTTNDTGYVFINHAIDLADAGKPLTLTVTVSSTDYVALTRIFNLKVYAPIRIVDSNVEWRDLNGNHRVDKGDVLYMWVKAETKTTSGTWDVAAGLKIAFVIHSPEYVMGTGTTNSSGIAELTYTITGDEGIMGRHSIYADDSDTGDVLGGPILLNGGANLSMMAAPAPELPILPMLLLAVILLLLLIKKKW